MLRCFHSSPLQHIACTWNAYVRSRVNDTEWESACDDGEMRKIMKFIKKITRHICLSLGCLAWLLSIDLNISMHSLCWLYGVCRYGVNVSMPLLLVPAEPAVIVLCGQRRKLAVISLMDKDILILKSLKILLHIISLDIFSWSDTLRNTETRRQGEKERKI